MTDGVRGGRNGDLLDALERDGLKDELEHNQVELRLDEEHKVPENPDDVKAELLEENEASPGILNIRVLWCNCFLFIFLLMIFLKCRGFLLLNFVMRK